jgi:hypothetical protein
MSNRLQGKWRPSLDSGWTSAKTFAIMGGLYAAVNCFAKRLRQKEDAWNGAASGCVTGLALGWAQGPLSALQSCGMLGAFSYFVDGMAGTQPAQAAALDNQDAHGMFVREQLSPSSSSRFHTHHEGNTRYAPAASASSPPHAEAYAQEALQRLTSFFTASALRPARGSVIEQLLTPALTPLACALAPCSATCTALRRRSSGGKGGAGGCAVAVGFQR